MDILQLAFSTRSTYRQDQVLTIDPIDPKVVARLRLHQRFIDVGLIVSFSAGDDKISVTNNAVSALESGKTTIKGNQAGDPSTCGRGSIGNILV